jgi:hypothetical protein
MARFTVNCNIIGTRVVFIGEHADRISRVRVGVLPVESKVGMTEYRLSDLPTVAACVCMEGWNLKVCA